MFGPWPPPLILVDANLLVKDVVSATLFDLNKAGLIRLHWTPEIEAEYIEHRARIRAEKNKGQKTQLEDLLWAAARVDTHKRYLVPGATPSGWVEELTLTAMMSHSKYAHLLAILDPDDIHVAMAAAYVADAMRRPVILATDNLGDFPQDMLSPFNVVVLHPGDVLEALYDKYPEKVSASLMKTCQGFQNPPFTPAGFLRSISGSNQFNNPGLAALIEADWGQTQSKIKQKG